LISLSLTNEGQFNTKVVENMKVLASAIFGTLVASALSTAEHNHQYARELQATPFRIYHFLCGDTMYTCGSGTVKADSQCKIKSQVTSFLKPVPKQCAALIAESQLHRGGALYTNTSFCPNKKVVKSYAKYRHDVEKNGEFGKICTKGKDCKCCEGGNGFGDPHFLTYDGTPFSYHGKCDLVMAHSESFGNGLGLRVHGRTELVDDWSRIRNAAVQIGQDTVELSNKGVIYLNGVDVSDEGLQGAALAGSYNITKAVKMLNNIPKTEVIVLLNEGHREKIKFSLFKNIINVHVGDTEEDDFQGMLGHKTLDGLVGRNQVALDDPTHMGTHWQVRQDEPMIFAEVTSPQHPEECVLPAVDGRRLRRTQQQQRRAAEACTGIRDPTMARFCLQDVMLSGDVDMTHFYHAGLN
jgi:von Willebrand factor type D domain